VATRARTRRFAGTASARRRRVWARHQATASVTTTASVVDLLALFEAAAGGRLSLGSTIGAVNLNLITVRTSGANVLPAFQWGLIVAGRTIDPADLDPLDISAAAGAHQDWMFWTSQAVASTVSSEQYRVKSMRKMEEVGQTLFLAMTSHNDPISVAVTASTLLILP